MTGTDLLAVRGLDVAYEGVQVLFGVDFDVAEGEIVALLGTNGAGKSTLLRAVSGLLQPSGGRIVFDGAEVTGVEPTSLARMGIAQVPGGRGVFPTLTVADNLRVAGWLYRDDPAHVAAATERVLEHFPVLRDRWDIAAGTLSGGEQQMLSLGQAFIARPKLLLIDELSLGLAPIIVEQLLTIVRDLHEHGTTIVIVEQSANTALKLAERAVFMEKGEVRFSGPTADLLDRPDILRAVFLKGTAASRNGKGSGKRRVPAAPSGDVVLETRGLTKRYGGIAAVDGVDLTLRDGEILGLIGPNGAGKTTLFDVVTGLTPTDGGQVLAWGQDVTDWPAYRRAQLGFGRSFQDARLWPSLTVREAVAVALERHVEVPGPLPALFGLPTVRDSEDAVAARVDDLIEELGLGAFRDKFVAELSTGSRRIVEIAAMLAHRPRILLLDEPSSGIAQRETESLGPMLRDVAERMQCSMLVIEHDMALITGLAHRIVALDQGAVIAEGAPNDVTEHPAVVKSYLGTAAEELAPR